MEARLNYADSAVAARFVKYLSSAGKAVKDSALPIATQKAISEFDRFGESLLGKETYWQKASGRRAAQRPDTDVVPPGILPGEDTG